MSVPSGAARLQNKVVCKECRDPDPQVIEDLSNGDMICRRCGVVLQERMIDSSTEYRTFADDGGKVGVDPTRVGAATNPLLAEGGLSTVMGKGGGLASDSAALRWQNQGGDDKLLQKAFHQIGDFSEKFNLPGNIVDLARQAFTKYYNIRGMSYVRGRGMAPLVAASVYIGCRQAGFPRTFKEICAVSDSSKNVIARAYKVIKEVIEASLDIVTGGDFMARFCSNLGLSSSISNAAIHVSKVAMEKGYIAGRSPVSVAAAAIYFVTQLTGDKTTVKQIADVAGCTAGTVKHALKDLMPYRAQLMPPNIGE